MWKKEYAMKKKIKVGIGFATGRKSFRKVLNAYMKIWKEACARYPEETDVSLYLFVAYDVGYSNTQSTDYTNLNQEIVDAFDEMIFIGTKNALKSLEALTHDSTFTAEELKSVFGAGYAGKRNAILYAALENGIDYLLFLDDDEYPAAVTNNRDLCLWSGQHVILSHLREIGNADYTNGRHCGYISPIPHITFDEKLPREDFRAFIEAISNDIINWENIERLMQSYGVTYADTGVLERKLVEDVQETAGCTFISGANLCVNLQRPERSFPFFNPPGARGEDTFLSTLLGERTVRKLPCYTFHAGVSIYRHLLDGVLPTHLAPITATSKTVVERFLSACIGWVRYKPLLAYIVRPAEYEEIMQEMHETLAGVLPGLASHFGNVRFMDIMGEFEKYRRNVKKHHRQFFMACHTWQKLIRTMTAKKQASGEWS